MKYWCIQKWEADVGICLCAVENQKWHLLRSYSPGETQQVQSHEGMGWEGRMKEKSMTLPEGCSSTQMSYKHHMAHPPSHRKGSQDNGRKWNFSRGENGISFQENQNWKYNKTFSHWSLLQGLVSKGHQNKQDGFSLDY